MNYEIWVCPFCREQIVGDDVGLDYAVHEHDGVGYVPVPIQLSPDRLPPVEGMLAAHRARDEENHRLAELERARDAAELAAMEEDRRAAEAELRRVRRENLEETLRLFDEQGPAAVPFWKLRDARRELAELT